MYHVPAHQIIESAAASIWPEYRFHRIGSQVWSCPPFYQATRVAITVRLKCFKQINNTQNTPYQWEHPNALSASVSSSFWPKFQRHHFIRFHHLQTSSRRVSRDDALLFPAARESATAWQMDIIYQCMKNCITIRRLDSTVGRSMAGSSGASLRDAITGVCPFLNFNGAFPPMLFARFSLPPFYCHPAIFGCSNR